MSSHPNPNTNPATDLGACLHVDLDTGASTRQPMTVDQIDRWLGGRGLNVGYLFRHLPTGTDPLGADTSLLFSCGLLTGTRAPAASRLHVNALSPLTGLIGSSNVGGYAGAWLRSTGVMSLVLRGRAKAPAYLYLSENEVSVRDAAPYWGLDALEVQARIAADLGQKDLQILAIGPAGESAARFACIVTGRDHAAGRTGLGAVMGAKYLKAIVIRRGRVRPFEHRRASIGDAVDDYVSKIKASPDYATFSRFGGAGYVKWADDLGLMGTRNYRQIRFEHVDRVDGRRLISNKVRSSGCYRCPVQCKADLRFPDDPCSAPPSTRPEFEPMINLGAKCGLGDLRAIVQLDNLCTRLGLDSTSAATGVAFAMDLYDRGILTEVDTGGMAVQWGDAAVMETLIRQMAAGEGLGRILAQGVKRAAAAIGRGADDYAAHVKGLELTAYHPAAILGSALGCAVSSRGGDYNNVYASLEHRWTGAQSAAAFGSPDAVKLQKSAGKGRLVRRAALVNIVVDSLGLCKVPALSLLGTFDLQNEARLVSAITGIPFDADGLFRIGDRVAAMERLFNLRHCPQLEADRLPQMVYHQAGSALSEGVLQAMLQEYYLAMGWDERGRPTPETLAALNIQAGGRAADVNRH